MANNTSKSVVGYWKCRGFGHPIILILEYVGADYEFRTHECGPPPHFDIKDWLAKKEQVLDGHHFPNLPYFEDDKRK